MKLTKIISGAAIVGATFFAQACGGTTVVPVADNTLDWGASIRGNGAPEGAQLAFFCPPGGAPSTIWGTDLYSDDSSVCTSAVHAGLITFGGGGAVRVLVQPGQAEYTGSTRNGVTSESYPQWDRSFSFVP